MGCALINSDQSNKAIIYLEKCLNINPDNENVLSSMGFALIKLHRYNDAIIYLEKALKIDTKNSNALFLMENALVNKRQNYNC